MRRPEKRTGAVSPGEAGGVSAPHPKGPCPVELVYEGSPPSKSNFRRSGKDWREKWRRIKQFENEIGWLARLAGARVRNGPAIINIEASNVALDLDNICKSTIDALCGVAFHDDSSRYLIEVHVIRRTIPNFTGLKISISYQRGDTS